MERSLHRAPTCRAGNLLGFDLGGSREGARRCARSRAECRRTTSRRRWHWRDAFADAVATYLAIAISRLSDIGKPLCRWESSKTTSTQPVWPSGNPHGLGPSLSRICSARRQATWDELGEHGQSARCISDCRSVYRSRATGCGWQYSASRWSRHRHGPTVLRQHWVCGPVGLLLCVATPVSPTDLA